MVRRRSAGQALVEFALVAPIVLLIIGATVDMGRGMLLYGLLSGASRDTARQATLVYYSGSNTQVPDCTALAAPCSLRSLVGAGSSPRLLAPLGVNVQYLDSTAIGSPPIYGTYVPNALRIQPGTITLVPGALTNTVYVFIYELDSNLANPSPRWSCVTVPCANAFGRAVRTSGHQRVVVDLKLKWRPVLATFLGIPAVITFDSQSVDRLEY
jgi:Flp pilus assembly protein TadG